MGISLRPPSRPPYLSPVDGERSTSMPKREAEWPVSGLFPELPYPMCFAWPGSGGYPNHYPPFLRRHPETPPRKCQRPAEGVSLERVELK